jgi:hypothetical protein
MENLTIRSMRYFLVAGISPPIIRNLGNNLQEIRQNTCEEIHQKWLLWSVDRNPPTSAEPNPPKSHPFGLMEIWKF